MSIQAEIDRINNAKNEIAEAISEKGVPVAEGTSIDNLPGLIRSIPQEGGGSGDCNFVVSTVFDISTMTITSISHTYDEIQSAIQEGKQVLFRSNYGLGISYGSLVSIQTNIMSFQLMIQANFGDGIKLYYFSIILYSDNRTSVNPFIVNTTSLGG